MTRAQVGVWATPEEKQLIDRAIATQTLTTGDPQSRAGFVLAAALHQARVILKHTEGK